MVYDTEMGKYPCVSCHIYGVITPDMMSVDIQGLTTTNTTLNAHYQTQSYLYDNTSRG